MRVAAMSKYRSRLKCLGNVLFILVAIALFILNTTKYAIVYLNRGDYELVTGQSGEFYIVTANGYSNETLWPANCSGSYSETEAKNILRWFVHSSTDENRTFHVFLWFMIGFALVIAVVPSVRYLSKYWTSNRYNTTERYCLSSIILLIRTFFSITAFLLPSFYLNTFDFNEELCLNASPPRLSFPLLPFVLVAMVCLLIYFAFDLVVNSFYEKHRFCCSIEWISYVGLCFLALVILGVVVFAGTVIAYALIVSFIEEPLRLTAILVIIQFPFLIVQILAD